MQFEGAVKIKAAREKVWAFLIDPHAVSQCAPGIDGLEILVPDSKFRARVALGLGSVKANFAMEVEFFEMDAPCRAKLKARGKAPGSAADMVSDMTLIESRDGSTELQWSTDVQIVGTIASLAARFAPGITKKLAGEFFDCVKQKLET